MKWKTRAALLFLTGSLLCLSPVLAKEPAKEVTDTTLAAVRLQEKGDQTLVTALQNQDYDKALALANEEVEKEPDKALSYSHRSMVYAFLEKYDLALADANKAVELEPGTALPYVNRGDIYTARKEYKAAIADFTKALSLPDAPLALIYMNRARSYAENEEYDKALADIKTGEQKDKNFYPLYLMESYIQKKAGHNLAAQRPLHIYVMHRLAEEKKYFLAGVAAEEAGLYSQAVTLLHTALAEDSQNADIYRELGLVYAKTGKYEEGTQAFTKAISLGAEAMDYNNRGECYRNLKKYDLAKKDYDQAVALAGDNDDLHAIYDSLGQWALAVGNYAAAENYFTQALAEQAYEEGYELRSQAREKEGKSEEAEGDREMAQELQQKALLQE